MANRCEICDKRPLPGNKVKRRGKAKAKGGAGSKITGITARRFFPNLQKIQAFIDGKRKSIYACAKCIKAGNVPLS